MSKIPLRAARAATVMFLWGILALLAAAVVGTVVVLGLIWLLLHAVWVLIVLGVLAVLAYCWCSMFVFSYRALKAQEMAEQPAGGGGRRE